MKFQTNKIVIITECPIYIAAWLGWHYEIRSGIVVSSLYP